MVAPPSLIKKEINASAATLSSHQQSGNFIAARFFAEDLRLLPFLPPFLAAKYCN
jgi:hypothetical protein